MIIDTHQHVFWHGRDDRGLVADLDEHGIDLAWLLTWEIDPDEDNPAYHAVLNPEHRRSDGTHAGIPLSDLIRTRNHYPDRFILGYCPDPRRGNAPQLLEAACKIHGVRVCGEWKFRMLIDDPRSINLFRKAGELGLPVVLHLDVPYLIPQAGEAIKYDPAWYGGTIDNLERAIIACPQTRFIGHAPGFWREISGDADTAVSNYPTGPITPGGKVAKLLEKYPNLYADLSAGSALKAIQRDPAYTQELFERFPDRFLYARDYYGGDLHAFLKTLTLKPTTRDAIMYQNAQRLLAST